MPDSAYIAYKVGDTVRIKSGAFSTFTARVEEVNEYAPILKV